MKIFFIFILLNSTQLIAQTDQNNVQVSAGGIGGSYYDVPTNHSLDKYGPERLSPVGASFKATLESDELGNIYFRKITANRKEDGTLLGNQTFFTYDSKKIPLKLSNKLDLFIKGNISVYDQKDHLMYFKVDQDFTPALDTNLEMEKHARVDQRDLFMAPEIGICQNFNKETGDFKLSAFVEGSLAPLGLLTNKSEITDNKMNGADLSYLNKDGVSFAFGGEILIEGMAKYKDKYYFKAKLVQTFNQGIGANKASATNRIGIYELGYVINKNASVNVNIENNELVLQNTDRKAIDVYNIVGVGLKYTIPSKKKK